MKAKVAERAFGLIRAKVHESRPVHWAGYDDEEPDLAPDDPDYHSEKAFLAGELDGEVRAVVRNLGRVRTERDLDYLLYRTFVPLNSKLTVAECEKPASRLFKELHDADVL